MRINGTYVFFFRVSANQKFRYLGCILNYMIRGNRILGICEKDFGYLVLCIGSCRDIELLQTAALHHETPVLGSCCKVHVCNKSDSGERVQYVYIRMAMTIEKGR